MESFCCTVDSAEYRLNHSPLGHLSCLFRCRCVRVRPPIDDRAWIGSRKRCRFPERDPYRTGNELVLADSHGVRARVPAVLRAGDDVDLVWAAETKYVAGVAVVDRASVVVEARRVAVDVTTGAVSRYDRSLPADTMPMTAPIPFSDSSIRLTPTDGGAFDLFLVHNSDSKKLDSDVRSYIVDPGYPTA